MIETLFNIKHILENKNIKFCFAGPVTHSLMENIGETLRNKLATENHTTKTTLNVFGVFVEQIENIVRYSVEKESISNESSQETELKYGIIMIGEDADKYYVIGGNKIECHKREKLENQLQLLSQMDKEALRKHYRQKRKEDPDSDSKGAGIGLIEIARKSDFPIEWDFEQTDTDCFFTICTTISKESK